MQPTEPRKSSKLWIIIGIIFLLLILVGGAGVYFGGRFLGRVIAEGQARSEQRVAKLKDLEAQQREIQQSLKDSLDSHALPTGMADRLSKIGKSAGEAAQNSSGLDKTGLIVSQRIVEGMAPAMAKYEAATKQLLSSPVTSPVGLVTREDLEARVKTVHDFAEANDGLKRVVEGIEGQVRQELDKEGVTGGNREEFVKGFMVSANVELNRTIRNCDTEISDTLLKMLAILDRDWGLWSTEGGKFHFAKPGAAEEFNKLGESLREVAARQSGAQQELLKQAKRRTGAAAVK